MRVFVTGASGHVAASVIPELRAAGHLVIGLARSEHAAHAVRALGAEVQMGDLGDLTVLREQAAAADGVIHLAFNHEQMRDGEFAAAASTDLQAIRAMGQALVGSHKPFVGANATLSFFLAGFGGVLTEDDTLPGGPRISAENEVIGLAEQGVRSSVVRLPPVVHSNGRYGLVTGLIQIAESTGIAGYVGSGVNRWPAVDTRDAAVLFRLALESAEPGQRWHGVAEEGVELREMSQAIGRRLEVPVGVIEPEHAESRFGSLTPFLALDAPVSSLLTRRRLGWIPRQRGVIQDIQDPRPAQTSN